jgi:hypothetical protein
MIVELRESADAIAHARDRLEAPTAVEETRAIVESSFAALQQIRETALTRSLSPGLAGAESFALRELSAARRHQMLAGQGRDTSRAACELALRSLGRALDALLAELIPWSLSPR